MWWNAACFSNNQCPVCESLTHDYWKIMFCIFFSPGILETSEIPVFEILQTKFLYVGVRRSAVFEWHGSFIWVALGVYTFLFNIWDFDLAIYTLILVLLCVHIHLGVLLSFNMEKYEWYLSNNDWQATVLALINYSDTPLA